MPLLNALISHIEVSDLRGVPSIPVTHIKTYANQVKPGDLYVAIPGARYDGYDFIDQAIANGAAAIVLEKPIRQQNNIVYVFTPNARLALARLAAALYDNPAHEMEMTGVTGTNGKTTVCYLIHALLKGPYKTGMLGTIDYRADGEFLGRGLTTPAPLDLHRLLRQMRDRDVEQCVMEVTSHALAQHRVTGIEYQYAVYTNLSSEHLDYHISIDKYLQAKLILFHALDEMATAIVNFDDPYALEVMDAAAPARVLTYALKSPRVDISVESLITDQHGLRMLVNTPLGQLTVESALHGRHNASNILAALGVGIAQRLDVNDMLARIARFRAVPGRFEPVECGQPYPVIVDFCHTPDALTHTLDTIRDVYKKNIITVFGCGGDRDQQKRPQMGRIASTYSQQVIITDDNPRTEDPKQIIRQIERGLTSGCKVRIIPDRRNAIGTALELATPDDAVLIAGKGHETWQEVNGVRHPFDDRMVVREFFGYDR